MPQSGKGRAPQREPEAQSNVVLVDLSDVADPLAIFQPEGGAQRADARVAPARARSAPTPLVIGGTAIAAVAIALVMAWSVRGRVTVDAAAKSAPPAGRAVLRSRPSGATVLVDGVARGVTPLEIDLAVGKHDVLLRSDTGERALALTVENATRLVEDVDMPAAAVTVAEVDVTSEPSGARVLLDGKAAGATPLKLRDVAAGRHDISVAQGSTTIHRAVDVAAGATASVFVSLAASNPTAATGTFVVDSPVELRLLENGQLLGLSNAAPLTVSAGKHQFELVNDALELRLTRAVTVEPGKAAHVNVSMPNGALFVNASPWAEVFVDGKSIGVTPLGNVAVTAGPHELLFRHPQLGERGRSIAVGARTPVRVAVDMRK